MGDYDRILKHNIENIILNLAIQYLGLEIKKVRRIREKLQILEREVDFAAIITTANDERSILHIEFQVEDSRNMVLRMAEYHGVWLRKYNLPVHHFVVYLGQKTPGMPTQLDSEKVFSRFTLLDFSQLDPEELISSQIPEQVLLAILSRFRRDQSLGVIRSILYRLKELSMDEKSLKNYVKQLTILSRLRKLEVETQKEAKDMPITYDIETDGLYLKGIEEGREIGLVQGIKKIMQKFPHYTDQYIADLFEISLELVQKVRKTTKGK